MNEGEEEEEEEEEEDFFNEEKRGVDFKRDVANRCVRAVARTASEEEQRMFGLAIIESLIPTKAAKAFGWFLRLFPDWFARRHAAFVTPLILPWLSRRRGGERRAFGGARERELRGEKVRPTRLKQFCRDKKSAGRV